MGVGTLAGLRGAGAQEAAAAPASEPSAEVVPCEVTSYLGNMQNGLANYKAQAETAEFAFQAPMSAHGDNITLFAEELGGAAKTSNASFRGQVSRRADGGLFVESLQVRWPFTALESDGQFFNVIGMAHEQNVPVGIVLMSGDLNIAEIVFEAGKYDPNSPLVGFDTATTALVSGAMLAGPPFKLLLAIGGTVYSSIEPEDGAYGKFLDETLLPAMDEAKRKDAETPCTAEMNEYESLDCFLTGACCAVIGLRDECWELQTLRRFRDSWLSSFAAGRADIARYYVEAPAVAQRLVNSAAGRRQLLGLYWRTIVPSAVLARLGANRAAYTLYRRMMVELIGPVRA